MGNGQMGAYMSHYDVVTWIQLCLCSMYSKAARLILENNDTKIKYHQLIWFLWMPIFFSKLGKYFTVFMEKKGKNGKEGRRKTNQG